MSTEVFSPSFSKADEEKTYLRDEVVPPKARLASAVHGVVAADFECV